MFINQEEARQLTREILHHLQVCGLSVHHLTETQINRIVFDILWRRGGLVWSGKEWVIDDVELWKDGRRIA